MSSLSIFHPQGSFDLPGNPFGKDVANACLFNSLLKYGNFDNVYLHTKKCVTGPKGISSAHLSGVRNLFEVPLFSTDNLLDSGFLLRGQPYLADLCWNRFKYKQCSQYSFSGLIHTVAPPFVRESIGSLLYAPVNEWDSLICTSPAVKHNVSAIFDHISDYLRYRFDSPSLVRPQLPLIPLGVDVPFYADLSASISKRKSLRKRLSIADEDIVLLWVGRFSYFEKAFPQSMFQSIARAQTKTSIKLHFILVGSQTVYPIRNFIQKPRHNCLISISYF